MGSCGLRQGIIKEVVLLEVVCVAGGNGEGRGAAAGEEEWDD